MKKNQVYKLRKGDCVEYYDTSTELKKVGEVKKVLKNGKFKLKGLSGEFSNVTPITEEGVSWLLFQQGVHEYSKLVLNMNTFYKMRGFAPIYI